MSEPKYEHRNYVHEVKFTRELVPLPQPKLNWFQRVILRRKPLAQVDIDSVSAKLAEAARQQEEELVWEMFNNGH